MFEARHRRLDTRPPAIAFTERIAVLSQSPQALPYPGGGVLKTAAIRPSFAITPGRAGILHGAGIARRGIEAGLQLYGADARRSRRVSGRATQHTTVIIQRELLQRQVATLGSFGGHHRADQFHPRPSIITTRRRGVHVRFRAVVGIPAKTPRQPPNNTASNWKWSNSPTPNAASSCCRGGGWSNAASRGPADSAGWSKTTNVCPTPLGACTSQPSSSSCSLNSPQHHKKVHNSLYD